MLTEQVQAGIKSVLSMLKPDDLSSLAATLTKSQINISDTNECVKVILAFTESGKDFLRRRVCSKAILCQYAYQEALPVSQKSSKEDLIQLILNHWSSCHPSNKLHDNQDKDRNGSNHHKESALSTGSGLEGGVTVNNFTININAPQIHIGNGATDTERLFGEQFTHWFYDNLNHSDPISQGFGSSSFLPEAKLCLKQICPGAFSEEIVCGCEEITKKFLALFRDFKFQPNYSDSGIRIRSSPHGLRLVLVCGTVYKDSNLVGVFEQSFGLVQDPGGINTWKIQFTELRLKEALSPNMPQLSDFCDVPEIEANAISSLEMVVRR